MSVVLITPAFALLYAFSTVSSPSTLETVNSSATAILATFVSAPFAKVALMSPSVAVTVVPSVDTTSELSSSAFNTTIPSLISGVVPSARTISNVPSAEV